MKICIKCAIFFFAFLSICNAAPLNQLDISWADSYSIGGACYCDSSFDHNIGSVKVAGPAGRLITVKEACDLVGSGPESNGEERRIYYNTIQCGHGPLGETSDEKVCPGRVDLGIGNLSGCQVKGPKWKFTADCI